MLGGGGGSRALKRASRIAAADPGADTAEFIGGVDSMCSPPRAFTLSMRPVSGKMAGAVNSKLLSLWLQARLGSQQRCGECVRTSDRDTSRTDDGQ